MAIERGGGCTLYHQPPLIGFGAIIAAAPPGPRHEPTANMRERARVRLAWRSFVAHPRPCLPHLYYFLPYPIVSAPKGDLRPHSVSIHPITPPMPSAVISMLIFTLILILVPLLKVIIEQLPKPLDPHLLHVGAHATTRRDRQQGHDNVRGRLRGGPLRCCRLQLDCPFGFSSPLYKEGQGLISSSAAPANKDEVEEEVNKEREAGVKLDSELRKSPVVASIESGPGTAFEFEHIFNDECASAASTCGARKKGCADNGKDVCRERGDKEVESVECADDDDGDDDGRWQEKIKK